MRAFNMLCRSGVKYVLTIFILSGQFLSQPVNAQFSGNINGVSGRDAAAFVLFFQKLIEGSALSLARIGLPRVQAKVYQAEEAFEIKKDLDFWNDIYLTGHSGAISEIRSYRGDLMIDCQKQVMVAQCEQAANQLVNEKTEELKQKTRVVSRKVVEQISRLYTGVVLNAILESCKSGGDIKSCAIDSVRLVDANDSQKFGSNIKNTYGGIIFKLHIESSSVSKNETMEGFLGVSLFGEELAIEEQTEKATLNQIMWAPKRLLDRFTNQVRMSKQQVVSLQKERISQRFASFDSATAESSLKGNSCELLDGGFCLIYKAAK